MCSVLPIETMLRLFSLYILQMVRQPIGGGMFLYQDAVFIGQVYGRDDKKIETDTLNLKGTGDVFRHEYTEDFWKSYDEKDTRRDATFLEYYTKKEQGRFWLRHAESYRFYQFK